MVVNITTGTCFLLVLLIVLYDFYSKKRILTLENKYFLTLTYLNLIGLLIEILIYFFAYITNDLYIHLFFIRFILVYYIIFMANLLMYYYCLVNKIKVKDNKKFLKTRKKVFIIYFFVMFILMIFPSEYSIDNYYLLSSGNDSYFAYFTGLFTLITIFLILRKNKNKISKKNNIILLSILFLGFISVIIQFYFPELLLIIPVHTIVLLLIYFSLENPDLKLIKKLEKTKIKAQKANSAKSEFLSNMSHEIRTPLNAIIGLSENLLESNENEKIKGDLEDILTASNLLLEIIGNVLDINKIESNKLKINKKDYSIKLELEKIMNVNKDKFKNKEISFLITVNKNVPKYLYGDPSLVKTIFTNLISNAIKYTEKGCIKINLNSKNIKDEYLMIFSVIDTGIGIKKSDQSKLFKKFSRVNMDKNSNIEGIGLGLLIVKKIVTLLKGEIDFTSELNKGSRFTAYFMQEKSNVKEMEKNIVNIDSSEQKNILVVDDNELNLKVFKRMLERENVKICKVNNGESCIEMVKKNDYDLIFLDIMMPGLNGVDTLKILRKIPKKNIKVIALTADAVNDARKKYLKLGFDDYIAKPFKKELLINKIFKV